jgi:hypothetical protein
VRSPWSSQVCPIKADVQVLPLVPMIFSGPRVSIQTQRTELERRHHALEQEIYEAQMHPSCDDLKTTELKRRKLLVKDEIARLPQDINVH